jgi:FkbM family methyltransferase
MIDLSEKRITYPNLPVTVPIRGRFGLFEIRNCRELIQRNIYFLGYYEFRETRLIRRYLRPGDTFIDVGANIGWFAIVAAESVGPTGKVVAFEPSSKIYSHLEKNVLLNSRTNIKLEKVALAHKNGSAILTGVTDRNAGKGTIMAAPGPLDCGAEEVPTIKFDDYVLADGLRQVRMIKIDVEGAEMVALQGAKEFLAGRRADYLMIEVNDSRLRQTGSSSAEVLRFLTDCGYRLFRIGIFGIRPLRPDERVSFANLFAVAS